MSESRDKPDGLGPSVGGQSPASEHPQSAASGVVASPQRDAAGRATPSWSASTGTRGGQLLIGRLTEHGRAAYQFRSGEDLSYYVKLLTSRGERTLWGKDLERAISVGETQPKVGDLVGARRVGRRSRHDHRSPARRRGSDPPAGRASRTPHALGGGEGQVLCRARTARPASARRAGRRSRVRTDSSGAQIDVFEPSRRRSVRRSAHRRS